MKRCFLPILLVIFVGYSAQGQTGGPEIKNFFLVNTLTDKELRTVKDGDVINMYDYDPSHLTIKAEVTGGKPGSIVFELDGQIIKVESKEPYALGPNTLSNNYYPVKEIIGTHTLTASIYSMSEGRGNKGKSLSVKYTLAGHRIENFSLINTNNNTVERILSENDTINLGELTHGVSIVANTFPKMVGSVKFTINNKEVVENSFPYALSGDNNGMILPYLLESGNYKLNATPFLDSKASGVEGVSKTISLTVIDEIPHEEQEQSNGKIAISGVNELAFNGRSVTLKIVIDSTTFLADPDEHRFTLNGIALDTKGLIKISDTTIELPMQLLDGKNILEYNGLDIKEYLITGSYTLWAGNNNLPVKVVDPDGIPVSNAEIVVTLVDDANVKSFGFTDDNGSILFTNIPLRTLTVTGKSANNLFGTAGLVGFGDPLTLFLKGFDEPSLIDNNDFSLGLEGWNVGNSPAKIVTHAEDGVTALKIVADNNDLHLTTSGIGPQSVSRTFFVGEGAVGVKVRYKFITSEVPGGYYGSQFNDYFSVAIRNETQGTLQHVTNAMNGFAFSEFDGNGALPWRELTLTAAFGDVIKVDFVVANVADGLYNSTIIIDYIDKSSFEFTKAVLIDFDNSSALKYLSLDNHSYFNGFTKVNGSIEMRGHKSSKLSSLKLEIWSNDQVISVPFNPALNETLFQPFGDDQTLTLDKLNDLFLIPSAAYLNVGSTVQLRMIATLESGEISAYDLGAVEILRNMYAVISENRRYQPNGKTPPEKDLSKGGDSWGKPSVVSFIATLLPESLFLGDLSNMNAGTFQPDHNTHEDGTHLDVRYTQYRPDPVKLNTVEMAQNLVELLGNSALSRIDYIYLSHIKNDTDPFYKYLNDYPEIKAKVRHANGHKDHFHMHIQPSASTFSAFTKVHFAKRPPRTDLKLENGRVQAAQHSFVFPNPVSVNSKCLQISLDWISLEKVNYEIYGSTGNLIKEGKIDHNPNSITIEINLGDASIKRPGNYYIHLFNTSSNQRQIHRFQVEE